MLDDKVLDEILPVPDRDELKNALVTELSDEGFVITNFSSGGIFYTLMMILIQIRIDIINILRNILNNMFVSHITDDVWLDIKAADYSKTRKQATKTQGNVTLTRLQAGQAVQIPKNTVFKTEQDSNGNELRYLALNDTIMPADELSVNVLVEAQKAGIDYNVAADKITKSLTYIDVDAITNNEDWITSEGSDIEDTESFRSRILNSWSELAAYPIRDKYKNLCEAIAGVISIKVDDLHPRGQGTIDIIVTSITGSATENLLDKVRAVADDIKSTDDNILVKASIPVSQDIELILQIPFNIIDDNIELKANEILTELLRIKKGRNLNELYIANIIYALKSNLPMLKNVKVIIPADDVVLNSDDVIVLGDITITIERV